MGPTGTLEFLNRFLMYDKIQYKPVVDEFCGFYFLFVKNRTGKL